MAAVYIATPLLVSSHHAGPVVALPFADVTPAMHPASRRSIELQHQLRRTVILWPSDFTLGVALWTVG